MITVNIDNFTQSNKAKFSIQYISPKSSSLSWIVTVRVYSWDESDVCPMVSLKSFDPPTSISPIKSQPAILPPTWGITFPESNIVLSIIAVDEMESDTVDVHARVTGAFELNVKFFSEDYYYPPSEIRAFHRLSSEILSRADSRFWKAKLLRNSYFQTS